MEIIRDPRQRRAGDDMQCDECGIVAKKLVQIGEEPDYRANWAHICQDCLAKAFQMLKDAAEEDAAHNI